MSIVTVDSPGGPLWWEGGCADQSSYVNVPDGFIKSPGYEHWGNTPPPDGRAQPQYDNNLKCEYRIEVPPGAKILFTMVALSLQAATVNFSLVDPDLDVYKPEYSDCKNDYVQVFNGDDRFEQNEIYPESYTKLPYYQSNRNANGTDHVEAQHGRMCGTGLDNTCFIGESQDYTGTMYRSKSNYLCQWWWKQEPHRHVTGSSPDHFKHEDRLPHRFCRNTIVGHGERAGPWCYTEISPLRWERCAISKCREEQQQLWSTSNVATVRFSTDSSVTSTGFLLSWTTVYPKIDSELCGLRPDIHLPDNGESEINPQISKRISGGQNARTDTWLFACKLYYKEDETRGGRTRTYRRLCGGTLVRNFAGTFFMITAGHCLVNAYNKTVLCVTDGGLGKVDSDVEQELFSIDEIVIHPDYNVNRNPVNDIAVVKLERTDLFRPFSDNLLAACLPNHKHNLMAHNQNNFNNDEDALLEKAIALGWGRVGRHWADPLQQIVVYILKKCFFRSAMCVTTGSSMRNPIRRDDDGSPLLTFRYNKDVGKSLWTLTGLAAFRSHRGRGGSRQHIYTDVFAYRDWINGVIN